MTNSANIGLLIFQIIQVLVVIIAGYLIICGVLYNAQHLKKYTLNRYKAKTECYKAKLELEKTKKEYKDWVYANEGLLKSSDNEVIEEVEKEEIIDIKEETQSMVNIMTKDNQKEVDIPSLDDLLKEDSDFFKHSMNGMPISISRATRQAELYQPKKI